MISILYPGSACMKYHPGLYSNLMRPANIFITQFRNNYHARVGDTMNMFSIVDTCCNIHQVYVIMLLCCSKFPHYSIYIYIYIYIYEKVVDKWSKKTTPILYFL